MARRPLLSPFTPRFNRFFDDFRDFDLDRTFQRPYWVDCSFENSHKLGSGIGQVTDNDEHFSVTIDVSQFAPEDLKVSVNEGMLIIEGKHPMIKDEFGEVCPVFCPVLNLLFMCFCIFANAKTYTVTTHSVRVCVCVYVPVRVF
ncbi:unnamed protein product [Gongylonema pulchrum]|uniref:SHSP domain-containing protein n=1 Tax=Gongylonema pulchrum TaxID=637853 RepID=A0A183EP08_9BILA|nr:unnamed protein product [Gongylonema pulchrum]